MTAPTMGRIAVLLATLVLSSAAAAADLRVIDGDTVALGDERLRLLDIDAPEFHRPRCPAEAVMADRARRRLADLLAGGTVLVERSGERDRYGRTLARLRVDDRDAGDVLMAEGLVVPWRPGRAAWEERRRHWCGD